MCINVDLSSWVRPPGKSSAGSVAFLRVTRSTLRAGVYRGSDIVRYTLSSCRAQNAPQRACGKSPLLARHAPRHRAEGRFPRGWLRRRKYIIHKIINLYYTTHAHSHNLGGLYGTTFLSAYQWVWAYRAAATYNVYTVYKLYTHTNTRIIRIKIRRCRSQQ